MLAKISYQPWTLAIAVAMVALITLFWEVNFKQGAALGAAVLVLALRVWQLRKQGQV